MGLRLQVVDGFSDNSGAEETHDRCLCRGLQKRMFRYCGILCDFSDASMREQRVKQSYRRRTVGGVVQPLLPSLLAACAPQAELILYVEPTQGKPAAPTAFLRPISCTAEIASWTTLRKSTSIQMCSCPV